MDSNQRLVLFTHALCRLSYPATLGITGLGFRARFFRDPAKRSERLLRASPSSTSLQSHQPWSGSHHDQSVRGLFGRRNQRQSKADFGLSTEIFGTRHRTDPCALPATLNSSSGSQQTELFCHAGATPATRYWPSSSPANRRSRIRRLPKPIPGRSANSSPIDENRSYRARGRALTKTCRLQLVFGTVTQIAR
jgi:hypothetical protein